MTAPTRPRRPVHIDPTILKEASARLGMPAREIVNVTDTKAGRVIELHDGTACIDVPADRPDSAGQTGLLVYRGTIGMHSALSKYVGPDSPRARQAGAEEAWSLADLDIEASRLHVPSPEFHPSGPPSRQAWVGADPIRARATWLEIAKSLDTEPRAAAHRNTEAAWCADIVKRSGWLSKAEAAAL